MSSIARNVYHSAGSFYHSTPRNISLKAAQGAAVTVAINFLAGRATRVIFLGGAAAATATIIEAVTRPVIAPLIGKLFPHSPILHTFFGVISVLASASAALSLVGLFTPVGVTYKVASISISVLGYMFLNWNGTGNSRAFVL